MTSTETTSQTRPGPKSGTADVRAELLAAAQETALERGIEAMSLRDIADRAGVNQAMIRYYFGDKRGLMGAMLDDGFDRLLASLEQDGVPEAQIATLTRGLSSMPWLPILMMQAVYSGDELRRAFMTRHAPRMMAVFQGLIPNGANNPMAVLTMLSALVFPHIARPLVETAFGTPFDDTFAENYARHLTTCLIKGDAL